jgi:hypothetical protein
LNIEYLRYSFDFKKDGAKRHQQIFNRSAAGGSIFNSGFAGLGSGQVAGESGVRNQKLKPETQNFGQKS